MGRVASPRGVAFLVLLAGCVGSPDDGRDPDQDPEDRDDPAGPRELPWGLEECRYVVSWGFVEGDRLGPYLPEGFTVRRGGNDLSPVPGAGDTLFGLDIMVCGSGVTLEGGSLPMEYGYLWAAADPPEAFLQEGVDPSEHYAKWEVLVPDAPRRAFLEEQGVPVRDGGASLETQPSRLEGRLDLDGLGTITFDGVPTMQWDPFDGSFVKVTPATGGAAAWRANATSGPRSAGEALIGFPDSSWMADVAGGSVLRGSFHAGVWSYDDARILLLQHDR